MTKAGTITKSFVENVDFYPTLLELCRVKSPDPLQGSSFVPILKNPELKGKEVAYTVVSRGEKLGRSIRTHRWRYAEWGSPGLNELYDLEKDPGEYVNQARDGAYRERASSFK